MRIRKTKDGLGKESRDYKNRLRQICAEGISRAKSLVAYAGFPGKTSEGCYASHHFPHRR